MDYYRHARWYCFVLYDFCNGFYQTFVILIINKNCIHQSMQRLELCFPFQKKY
jgi:hypothetical protein